MDSKHNSPKAYLETQVLTAAPEQLQLMLYDGAIRFCEQARGAIETKEIEKSYQLLSKAENIILELLNSMRDEIAPETCANMRRLYLYCYEQLVEANLKKELKAVESALEVLRHLRETWVMLMDRLKAEQAEQQGEGEMAAVTGGAGAVENGLVQEVGATCNFEG